MEFKMKKGILAFALVFGWVILASSQAFARKYKIIHMSHSAWTTIDVAQQKGFWKKEGLDTEVVIYQTADDVINAIKNARADISMVNVPTLAVIRAKDNNEIVYLGTGILWGGGYYLVVKKGFENKSLEGMRVGVAGGDSAGMVVLDSYVKRKGYDRKKVRTLAISNDVLLKNFNAGRLKAVVIQERSFESAKNSGGIMVERSPVISIGMASYTSKLKGVPEDDLKKLYRGWMNAIKWSEKKENWDEFKQIMDRVTFKDLPKLTNEKARLELKNIRKYNTKELLDSNYEVKARKYAPPVTSDMIFNDAAIKVLKGQ